MYIEVNIHENHTIINEENISEKNGNEIRIIKNNINKPLDFHYNNFGFGKFFWKKSKIKHLLYNIRENILPKEEIFLLSINKITINLSGEAILKFNHFIPLKVNLLNIKKN